MKIPPYLLPALLLIGCASHQSVTDLDPGPLPKNGGRAENSAASIRLPEQEKAYPVGRYRDPRRSIGDARGSHRLSSGNLPGLELGPERADCFAAWPNRRGR